MMKVFLLEDDVDDFLFNITKFREYVTNHHKKNRPIFDRIIVKKVRVDDFTQTLTGKEMLKVVETFEY